jgi:hypothetical protein
MANDVSAFFQVLAAATQEASQVLAPTWNAAQSVYVDYKPEAATIGQTLNVAIPQDPTNSVSDVGTGDMNLVDISFTSVPIVMNRHPEIGYLIRSFEQFNSPIAVRNVFLDAALKAIKTDINKKITGLFTTTNFVTNSAISTTTGLVSTTQFLQGQAALLDQNVPAINDPANMSLLLPSVPYTKVEGDANWTQAQIAGNQRAEDIHETGVMPTSYGATLKVDQNMPVSGVVGSRTWTAAYFHRWAVALVTRPLPQPDPKVVQFMYVDFYGIPVLIQVGWNQIKGGYVVTIEAGYGLKVVRENMGQLFTIAE